MSEQIKKLGMTLMTERIGWWRIGRLNLYGRHSWAQVVATVLDQDLTPVFF